MSNQNPPLTPHVWLTTMQKLSLPLYHILRQHLLTTQFVYPTTSQSLLLLLHKQQSFPKYLLEILSAFD